MVFLIHTELRCTVNHTSDLGLTVNNDNSIEEDTQHTITLGNKAYYANQFLFKSRMVSKKSKLKLLEYYKSNSNICLYSVGLERNHKKTTLMVFGRKVLRKILGTTKERDGTWRIKINCELNELIRHRNIISRIKPNDEADLAIYIEWRKRER